MQKMPDFTNISPVWSRRRLPFTGG